MTTQQNYTALLNLRLLASKTSFWKFSRRIFSRDGIQLIQYLRLLWIVWLSLYRSQILFWFFSIIAQISFEVLSNIFLCDWSWFLYFSEGVFWLKKALGINCNYTKTWILSLAFHPTQKCLDYGLLVKITASLIMTSMLNIGKSWDWWHSCYALIAIICLLTSSCISSLLWCSLNN